MNNIWLLLITNYYAWGRINMQIFQQLRKPCQLICNIQFDIQLQYKIQIQWCVSLYSQTPLTNKKSMVDLISLCQDKYPQSTTRDREEDMKIKCPNQKCLMAVQKGVLLLSTFYGFALEIYCIKLFVLDHGMHILCYASAFF